MKAIPIVVCVAVILAGCPADKTPYPHSLGPRLDVQMANGSYQIEGSVDLGGRPPSDIVYHDVKLIIINESTTMAEYRLGNMDNGNGSVNIETVVSSRPDEIRVTYDELSGADQAGDVYGYKWDDKNKLYKFINDYNSEY